MEKLQTVFLLLFTTFMIAQVPSGVPVGMEELYLQNNASFQEFKVLKAKSTIGTGILNVAAQKIP